MNRTAGVLVVVGSTLVVSGCLQMESAHRLYLSPRGEVSWTVQQTDVRSDAGQADARQEEEAQWLNGVEQDSHPAVVAFATLGARQTETQLLRRIRPYSLAITGEFGRIDDLANRILNELQVDGRATLQRHADTTTLTIEIHPPDGEEEYDGPLTALFEDLRDYRIALSEGRFIAAEGFRLSPDGAVATPADPAGTQVIHLSLTWTIGGRQ